MSNIVTRLFADHLKDPDYGVAAIVGMMGPLLYPGDALPDVSSLTIADETRDAWVKTLAPDEDPAITYPAIRVVTVDLSEVAGVADQQSTGARTLTPTVRIAAQLILRDSETSALSDAMYLLRALRASWAVWDDPRLLETKTQYGVSILPTLSRSTGRLDTPLGSNMVSPGAVMGTIPYLETLPLSS